MRKRTKHPLVVVLGGPNGAGKSTVSSEVLEQTLRVIEFVNADVIARGLSGFDPDRAALQAGRIMLRRLDELEANGSDFAFETTMASRSFAPRLSRLRKAGYEVRLYFVWVDSPELSIQRVARRVRAGGHNVPAETIRRRYERGIMNFLHLYLPLANYWALYDNSDEAQGVKLVAEGGLDQRERIHIPEIWYDIIQQAVKKTGDLEERSSD